MNAVQAQPVQINALHVLSVTFDNGATRVLTKSTCKDSICHSIAHFKGMPNMEKCRFKIDTYRMNRRADQKVS